METCLAIVRNVRGKAEERVTELRKPMDQPHKMEKVDEHQHFNLKDSSRRRIPLRAQEAILFPCALTTRKFIESCSQPLT